MKDLEKMDYAALVKAAIDQLEADDDLFISMVNELDSWNGFADGFRAFPMDEINDFYYDVPATQLINDLTNDFNINDDYFYYSIWGLESTGDVAGLYRDHADAGEVFDNIIENYNHLYFGNENFESLIDAIVNFEEEA